MANENKDVANSLNKYTDYAHRGTNLMLDGTENINKWYQKKLDEIVAEELNTSRLETAVDNTVEENNVNLNENKIETKVGQYNKLQTNENNSKLQTSFDKDAEKILNQYSKKEKATEKIATAIKGAKLLNNTAQKAIKTGKDISAGINEDGTSSFKESSTRIMTKPIKKIANKVTNKATKETIKYTKKYTTKFAKKIGSKVNKQLGKKILSETKNVMIQITKLIAKLVASATKMILSLLPQIAPIIIIIVIIAAIGNFFNFKTSKEADDVNFDEISDMIITIDDENLQAIYNEFLKNKGTPYLMDHSNLSYDTCMETYDCSSWVIHCLAHTGIKTIPNTGAQGIYDNYCDPINIEDRKAGDLIFLKDTYDTGEPGSISHVGIYMGELTINGENAEWIIDTGGNPEGVKIGKYQNGWWNGENFYGFGRLKGE